MKTYYVSIACYGSYEDREEKVIYAGEDYEQAKQVAASFQFPNPDNNYTWIDHWKDGVKIKHEEVINN